MGAVLENNVWYLKQNRLFADASDSGRVVFLVKTGTVKIARLTPEAREVTVAILGAGDIFGEETLFEGAPARRLPSRWKTSPTPKSPTV